jgi:glutamate dehydrogenase (NADP+)
LSELKRIYNDRKTLSSLTLDNSVFYSRDICGKPWFLENIGNIDIMLPCATQNEIDSDDAKRLVDLGCKYIAEGSNISSTKNAINYFVEHGVMFGPSKSTNSGGVAISGVEIMQNASRIFLTRDEVDTKLKDIMKKTFNDCITVGKKYLKDGENDDHALIHGANIASFLKISQAVREQGYFY